MVGHYRLKFLDLDSFNLPSDVGGVRILSGFIVRCLSVEICNFQSRGFSSVRISNLNLILTDRHRTVNPDRIRTVLSADVWSPP